MTLRYFAICTLLLAVLVFVIEVAGVLIVPDISASIERSKTRGDPELRNLDVARWTQMALVGDAIAISLAIAFVISGVSLLRRRLWARQLFVAASVGVLAFMVAGAIHHFDVTQLLHIGYALALLLFGWWFLFRSRAAAGFSK